MAPHFQILTQRHPAVCRARAGRGGDPDLRRLVERVRRGLGDDRHAGLRPIQPAIYNFIGYLGREWGPLTASASLAILPILVIFLALGS